LVPDSATTPHARLTPPSGEGHRAVLSLFRQQVQRYILRNTVQMSATMLPFIRAAQDSAKVYVYERGFKIRFERTWLDKLQG
jgi:hypothetical protein